MTRMKAVRIHEYGSSAVLRFEDAPRPHINEGEVLIRVHAAAVNPLDWKVRSGRFAATYRVTFPLILGWDVAGVVEAVAGDVNQFQIGDEVYCSPDTGGYAEYVAVRADEVAPKPRRLDFVQAAAIPISALTAWQAFFRVAHLSPGQCVLIHGAAGGVGTFAVQVAKWCGAYVIGTASGHNLAFLRQLGADEVIDYTTTRFENVVRQVDVILDAVGGDTLQRSWSVLKPGGTLVALVDTPSAAMAAAYGVRQHALHLESPKGQQLAQLGQLVDAGRLKPIVSTVLPLHEVRKAHSLSESLHTRGKIVMKVKA